MKSMKVVKGSTVCAFKYLTYPMDGVEILHQLETIYYKHLLTFWIHSIYIFLRILPKSYPMIIH